jgi:C-terminal processing protease CtpA/Prc
MQTSAVRDFAGAAIGIGVLGVAPVAAMIVADEVEHFRCGIGCVLQREAVTGRFVVERAMRSQPKSCDEDELEEGDLILRVADTWLKAHHSLQDVSALIRGREGTILNLLVLKPDSYTPISVSMVRRRLPGAKTEMLGALWQVRACKLVHPTYSGRA